MNEIWSSSQLYLVGGTVTLIDCLNGLGCSWVASSLSPPKSEEFSSDLLSFRAIWEFVFFKCQQLPKQFRLLLSNLLIVSIWIWEVLFWSFRPFRAHWELNPLFLSVYWTVWSSTLRFILCLWLVFQHWFFVKNHILLVKVLLISGSQSLKPLTSLVNPMKIYFLKLDSSLFFFWLSIKLYAGQPKIRKVE